MRPPPTWAYGITTVPQRASTLLPQTIASLASAGFDKPRLFVDGSDDSAGWKALFPNKEISLHQPALRTAGNWVLSAHELLMRNPLCDRYAIFQDDLVAVRNLRAYLDTYRVHRQGYWNLYTFPQNQAQSRGKGWFTTPHRGLSALALVFSREGLMRLLSDYQIVARPTDQHRGWHNIDGGIVEAMKRAGYQEWVHDPSLVQHTGDQSVSGHAPHAHALSFPGEDFNAMELPRTPDGQPTPPVIQPPAQLGLGDAVERGLSLVGVTRERVERWLGRPCGCKERREKLNLLGSLARRAISGKIEGVKGIVDRLLAEGT